MPTYGYECLACHDQIEVFQSIKDAPLTTCEACGGTLRKRVYPVGIAFKGSGFYVNDYAAKPADSGASEKAGGAPAETAKSETPKTDAQTEAPKAEASKAEASKAETKSAAPAAA